MIELQYSAADVPALAALHERAFPGFFLSALGPGFLRQLYLGYIEDPDAVISLARGQDGHIVGVCIGTTHPSGFFHRLLTRQFFGFFIASSRAVFQNPRQLPRLIAAIAYRGDGPADIEGALLSSLCVAPEAQGSGVGRALDEAWRAQAAALGARVAFLTTDAKDNDDINRFYERGGWLLHDEFVTKRGRHMNRFRHELAGSTEGLRG